MESIPQFVLRDVTIRFGSQTPVFEDLNLRVESGEFLTLVGPSGCGKSTLLRLLAGLMFPSGGAVQVKSGSDSGAPGFVFQQPALLPWRTAIQNVRLPLELGRSGSKSQRTDEELVRLMIQVGLKPSDQNKRPPELSGGMQMRLSLARALVDNPRVLLLDEPFAAVDDLLRMKLQEELRTLHEDRHLTTLLVTHNLQEAAYLSDRVIVFSGAPSTITADLRLERPEMSASERRTALVTMQSLQQITQAVFRHEN